MSKSIPAKVYRDLNISQRIRAAWQAQNRDDTSELEKLTNPADAGEYVIDRVSAVLFDLQVIGMAAQIDMLNCVISNLTEFMRLAKKNDPEDELKLLRQIDAESGNASAIAAALRELAEQIGLSPESILESLSPIHPVLRSAIEHFADQAPRELTEEYRRVITSFLKRRHPKIACFHPAEQEK